MSSPNQAQTHQACKALFQQRLTPRPASSSHDNPQGMGPTKSAGLLPSSHPRAPVKLCSAVCMLSGPRAWPAPWPSSPSAPAGFGQHPTDDTRTPMPHALFALYYFCHRQRLQVGSAQTSSSWSLLRHTLRVAIFTELAMAPEDREFFPQATTHVLSLSLGPWHRHAAGPVVGLSFTSFVAIKGHGIRQRKGWKKKLGEGREVS